MISLEAALDALSRRAHVVVSDDFMPTESVRLSEAAGRVLREVVMADMDQPPFARSIRDGFAVRAGDVSRVPVELAVVGESRAGVSFEGRVEAGQACEIMTGAEVPVGADAVVMVEDTERLSRESVRILRSVNNGQSTQAAGSECHQGDVILEAGRRIGVSEAAVLAATGHADVSVSRRPRVAILSTGDELVDVTEAPGPAQIRNSNSVTLAAQVWEAGGEPRLLGIARDNHDDLARMIERGLACDILITSGGVSMGKYDLVAGVLDEHGVKVEFDKVAMKPGKPTVFGWRERTFVFGLPGNPVSTIVAFQLFVRPLIGKLLHCAFEGRVQTLEAILDQDVRCDPVRAACIPAQAHFEEGAYRLAMVAWKGSSDLTGLAKANAFVMIPMREGTLEAGSRVQFIAMGTKALP